MACPTSPPPLPTFPSEGVRILSQGKDIYLTVWRAHPEAVTLLFCPSTMASPLLHTRLLVHLRRLGCNVVGLHPIGHGLAQGVQRLFTFADLVQNSLDAARWITQNFGGPLVVTGHSQGGILALAHAVRNAAIAAAMPICTLIPTQSEAASVTLFAPFMRHKDTFLKISGMLARLMPWLPVLMPMYLSLAKVSSGAYYPEIQCKYLRSWYPLVFVDSLFRTEVGLEEHGRVHYQVQCPLHVISARNDALFPPELMQSMLDVVESPDKKLILLENGGHSAPFSPFYSAQIAALIAGQCAALGFKLHP